MSLACWDAAARPVDKAATYAIPIGSFTQNTKETLLMSRQASVTKSIHSVSLQAGKTMTVESTERGHLVSADCGNVHTIEQLP